MSLLRFLLLFVLVTLILGFSIYVVELFDVSNQILVPKIWIIFTFMAAIKLIAYLISWAGIKMGGEGSVFVIMGPIVMKLLFSLTFVVIYLRKIRVDGVFFALEFFSLYFLFTAFEVYCLLRNLRDQNKKLKSPNR